MSNFQRKFFGNAAFSLVCALVIGVCAYLVRRITANGLPGDEYAFFYSTFSLVGMMVAFASLGIPNAAFFFIPDYCNRGEEDKARGVYSWCLRAVFAVGVFLTVVGLPAALILGRNMERYGIASPGIFWLLLLLPLPICVSVAMTMLLNGMKEFVAANLLLLWNTLSIFAGVLLFLDRYGLAAVIVLYASGAFTSAVAGVWWCIRKHRYGFWHPLAPEVRGKLLKAGGWLLLSCTGYYYFSELGNVLLSFIGTPEETLKFNIALPVALMIRPLYSVSGVFAPFSNQLFQERKFHVLRRSARSMLGITLLMMLAAGGVFAFFGGMILTLLFGARFAPVAPCTLILIEGALLWNAARFYADMLNSMRRERQAALIAGASALVSVVLYFIFCPAWGAEGTAWAALIASGIWMASTLTAVLAVLKRTEAAERPPRKILLFHSGSIGDTVIVFPMLKAVREKWRDAEIVLFTYSGYSGVACVRELTEPSGLVDRVIGFSTSGGKFGIVARLISATWRVRRERFDLAVNINRTPTALYPLRMKSWRLWCRMCGIPRHMGDRALFIFPPRREGVLPPAVPHHLDMIAARLEADGIAVTDRRIDLNLTADEIARAREIWDRNIPGDKFPVAFGVGGKQLRWPMEKYAELCRRISPLGIYPVFFGGRENSAEIDEAVSRVGLGFNAADTGLSLRQTVAFMARCKFYVGNDTGTLHMAVAAGLKCVGVYSAHNYPACWHPYGEGHVVVKHELPCAVCLKRSCPRGRAACIEDIPVDEVEAAVRQMFERTAK